MPFGQRTDIKESKGLVCIHELEGGNVASVLGIMRASAGGQPKQRRRSVMKSFEQTYLMILQLFNERKVSVRSFLSQS
jgi:hypothetical protein